MENAVPFFNVIHIPKETESEALEVWRKISDMMEKSDGCLSTCLHRNLKKPGMYINYAVHPSLDDFLELSKSEEFQALSQKLIDLGVKREAGVYEVVHSFSKS